VTAAVAGRDASTDIAVLKAKDATAQTAFADAADVRVGHLVFAVGRRGTSGVVATHGIVSALGGAWRTWHGGRIDQWFRLDLQPYTGFSGGPLVDARGRVIGINTSGPRRSVMTIPAATVNRVVDQLLTKGRVTRGYIGVGMQPVQLSDALKRTAGVERDGGLLVVMVEPDGPAEKAGVLVGDIVVAVDDQPLGKTSDLQAVLDPERVGKSARLRVLRGGALRDVAVTIGERKE
jgi:S1-C subfamily serine protease